MIKNKNKNQTAQTAQNEAASTSAANAAAGQTDIYEDFIRLKEYLSENNVSESYFYNAFYENFFTRTFAAENVRVSKSIIIAEDEEFATTFHNRTRLSREDVTLASYFFLLIQKKHGTHTIPEEFVFRCPTEKLVRLTESLDRMTTFGGTIYCNSMHGGVRDHFVIKDLTLVENYTVGNIISNNSVEVQINFAEWLKYLLKNDILKSGVNYLIYDEEWVGSELALQS